MRPSLGLVLAAAALVAGAARADSGSDALRTRLLSDLSSEAAAVREQASDRLETMDGLTPDLVLAALRDAPARARPDLLRIAGMRRMKELVPAVASASAGADARAAEAALRAAVLLGTEGTDAVRAALRAAADEGLAERERVSRLRHLEALAAQQRVEREVLSRWRRKGGSYRGRYVALAAMGWEVQPVLLAMLLDVPLEDQHVVVPPTGDEDVDRARRAAALREIAASRRRGYRTFEPLPPTIEPEEVFDLAQQALTDVADLDLLRDVLEETQGRLLRAHNDAVRRGWRPRPWEDQFAQEIEIVLAARGAPEPLEDRRDRLRMEVDHLRRTVGRMDPEENALELQYYSGRVGDLAAVLHQLREFDAAARRYAEVVEIVSALTGREPSVTGYNRACALAQAGRKDDAIEQLARSLDPRVSSGSEDLTREWVLEDGDLAPLHGDPRFEAIVKKRFGP